MADFFDSKELRGEEPFRCYVCHNILMVEIEGEYVIKLRCFRCKTKMRVEHKDGETKIDLQTMNPLPGGLVVKHGELVKL